MASTAETGRAVRGFLFDMDGTRTSGDAADGHLLEKMKQQRDIALDDDLRSLRSDDSGA